MTSTQRNILNLVLFQIFWFACVLGGNLMAAAAMVIYVCIYVGFIGNPLKQWKVLITISACGLIADSLLMMAGIIDFGSSTQPPFWLIFLWLGFATLFFHGLHWLRKLPLVLIAVLGALAGPVTYGVGAQFNDTEITAGLVMFTLAYGLCWALLLPLFTHMPKFVYRMEESI